MKTLIKYITLLFLAISSAPMLRAQSNGDDKEKQVQELIQSKQFSFVAQMATSQTGRYVNLTTPYDLSIQGDTVVSDLPYFGRAYVADYNGDQGIKFTSASNGYSAKEKKKGGWDITITPKDSREVRQLFLNVTSSGYASLQVLSNNRQSISFNGYIASIKKSQ